MDTLTGKDLNRAMIAELKSEASKTRKMIERVPLDKSDWKPHPKSMNLGRLAVHVVEMTSWITFTIEQKELDFSKGFEPTPIPKTNGELVSMLDELVLKAEKSLQLPNDLNESWTLRNGEHIYFTLPKKVVLRDMCFNHIIHHRGQLSVYLRLLDVPVPGVYGPSADER